MATQELASEGGLAGCDGRRPRRRRGPYRDLEGHHHRQRPPLPSRGSGSLARHADPERLACLSTGCPAQTAKERQFPTGLQLRWTAHVSALLGARSVPESCGLGRRRSAHTAIAGQTAFMSVVENKAVVQRWVELWNERGPDGVDEVFAEDFHDNQLASRLGTQVSLEAFKASLHALIEGMGHAQFETHELIGEGDSVVIRWSVHGVHQGTLWGIPPTGKAFAIEGVNVFRIRDGKIVERRSFLDPGGVLGLLR